MTKSVGIHEAKTHLSSLLVDVQHGEEVVITRRGRAVARLIAEHPAGRTFGIDAGVFVVPDDFDAPLPSDLLDQFER